ncbi:hypothetical protein KDA_60190 [Dictyobacter alpinus]|uniref:Blue (type 1) copper domain-containing protein n=1 Tax=Dictyobacter alpinus TaxID=2014873 RepID=A0A402BGM8_9CHLR|nr:plastocyanin/azurin family copper-binding protein [Dictyobacter alpinus]GCE30535.1 hypothetical protein KDA_60190 [Dictyobacter alpinus]
MKKRVLALLGLCITTTLLLVACGTTTADSGNAANQVHMDNTSFTQLAITIHKGDSITLVSDTIIGHTIANGTWKDGSAQPGRDSGAPAINNITIGGNNSGSVGPFNTAGTYKLYCTVHSGMNLTVIVN